HGGGPLVSKPGGRYSTFEDQEFSARVAEFEADPNPLNLLPDVALLRAFLVDMVDNWQSIFGPEGSLTLWNEAQREGDDLKQKPLKLRQIPDFSAISTLVVKVGDMVEKIQRQRARTAVPLDRHNQLMELVGEGLEQALILNRIEEEIAKQIRESAN